jgi:leucyl-tRNA synthetase
VDFVCLEKKLVVEADGEIHNFQTAYDLHREGELIVRGYRLLRFRNSEVIDQTDAVISRINKELRAPFPFV